MSLSQFCISVPKRAGIWPRELRSLARIPALTPHGHPNQGPYLHHHPITAGMVFKVSCWLLARGTPVNMAG